MHPTWNNPRPRLAWAIACLALTSACTGEPTAPPGGLHTNPVLGARGDGLFVSNRQKYADAGAHPVTGRSGSATMSAMAILSSDGSAQLQLVAGGWSGWTRDRRMGTELSSGARLNRAQIKVSDPAGSHLYTETHFIDAQTASIRVPGLVRGGRVQVQGIIVGADRRRVGVVTTDVPAVLKPDLAVTALQVEPRVHPNTPVSIVGVVQERNGDLGAWADCVLYVDGAERDRAHGIWIDANGAASCLFTQSFASAGSRNLEVRVENVAPGDYQPGNNSASRAIEVEPLTTPSPFQFQAGFNDARNVSVTVQEGSWASTDGLRGGESVYTDSADARTQQSYLSARMTRPVQFPLTELSARQFTSIEDVHSTRLFDVAADWTVDYDAGTLSCVSRVEDDATFGRAWVNVCTYTVPSGTDGVEPTGWTSIQYERYAGDVTYASREHGRFWNRTTGVEDYYSWNSSDPTTSHNRMVRYEQDYSFAAEIIEGGRTSALSAAVPLTPFAVSGEYPPTCRTVGDAYITDTSCTSSRYSETGVSGFAEGQPTP